MNQKKLKILITNSHADNRGDEAAQRGMIAGIKRFIPEAQFVVLTNSPQGLCLPEQVKVYQTFSAMNRRFPFFHFPFIAVWMLLRKCGIRLSFLNRVYPAFARLEEIADADIVLSCPGGPYIGELYRSHEITEHLFHLWIARFFKKPMMMYGPSMGPFTCKWRNYIRRGLLNRVQIITLRDPISREYLKQLNLAKPVIHVTADSAFQYDIEISPEQIPELMISQKIIPTDSHDNTTPLIGFTPAGARWNFKNMPDAKQRQDNYIRLMARMLDYLVNARQCRIVIFPQLYGRNTDMPLINRIIEKTTHSESIRIVSDTLDSDQQQALISQMDLMIGNRYHSVIFALKHAVPTVCIAYEHKSEGVMQQAGLEDYLIHVRDLTFDKLTETIDAAWQKRAEIRKAVEPNVRRLQEQSLKNSLAALALVMCVRKKQLNKKELEREITNILENHRHQ